MKALAVQQPRLALQSVSVHILTSEVKDNLHPRIKNGFSKCLGGQLRIPARIIGDGNPRDAGIFDELTGKRAGFDGVSFPHGTADRYEFNSEEEF
jgi:hypothetical protein